MDVLFVLTAIYGMGELNVFARDAGGYEGCSQVFYIFYRF